jgi:DNA-binding NtrC family response regulator
LRKSQGGIDLGKMELHERAILLVEDNIEASAFIARRLRHEGATVYDVTTVAEGMTIANQNEIDLALLDLNLPDGSGIDLLARLRTIDPDLPVIMFTQYANVRSAVEAMRLGAIEYLIKPFDPEDLEAAIGNALTMDALRREVRHLRRTANTVISNIARGNSPAMKRIWEDVEKVAPKDSNVVLLGENGTGKEVLARAIHAASPRANGPFIPVNCGGITETLIEDQLFGHEAHSFTDARTMRRGDFELADKGSIFLDEIGEMPLRLQAALLRVLQERRFFRIGGEREIHVDVRVIAATNRDLGEMVRQKQFREDLFFRLDVMTISVPPLRERREDIPALAATFLGDLGRTLRKTRCRLSQETLRLLIAYDWPGNVRQLRNVLERALILADGQDILPEHLPPEIKGHMTDTNAPPDPVTLWDRWIDAAPFIDIPLDELKEQLERHLVLRALRRCQWKKANAARLLGISAELLRFRMQKYDIRAEEHVPA